MCYLTVSTSEPTRVTLGRMSTLTSKYLISSRIYRYSVSVSFSSTSSQFMIMLLICTNWRLIIGMLSSMADTMLMSSVLFPMRYRLKPCLARYLQYYSLRYTSLTSAQDALPYFSCRSLSLGTFLRVYQPTDFFKRHLEHFRNVHVPTTIAKATKAGFLRDKSSLRFHKLGTLLHRFVNNFSMLSSKIGNRLEVFD